MLSLYHAYQAYERRHIEGEFDNPAPRKPRLSARFYTTFLSGLGDLLIRAGLSLKRRCAAGRAMTLSPLSGYKP
jgi:hypothetical protein